MGGCGCKNKNNNQQSVGSSPVTIQINETTTNPIQQQVNNMEQQVDELVKKIEQINDTLDQPDAE